MNEEKASMIKQAISKYIIANTPNHKCPLHANIEYVFMSWYDFMGNT